MTERRTDGRTDRRTASINEVSLAPFGLKKGTMIFHYFMVAMEASKKMKKMYFL